MKLLVCNIVIVGVLCAQSDRGSISGTLSDPGGSLAPNATAEDTVLAAFHILNQFDIPKGSVINAAIGEPTPEITEWTSVADLKNLRWYFRTFGDQSIRMVDLKQAVAAAKGEMRTIPMEGTTETIGNASTNFAAGK
jgi:choloylglycine hydrolase